MEEAKRGEYRVFVRIDTVRVERLERDVPVWCRAKGEGDYTLVSDVAGVVGRILKGEGDRVRKGDTLLYLYRGPAYGEAPVLAPLDGRLSLLLVSQGDPVGVGTPLALVSRGGRTVVEMVVPMLYRGKVERGMPVEYDGKRGRLRVVSDLPLREVGGYPAKATIPGIEPGEMGICRIIYRETPPLKVVPASAVYGGKVFKVVGGRAKAVAVEVVFEDGKGKVGIEGDLKRGDTVVVLGMESLKDGDRVVF